VQNNITPAEISQWTNHRVMEWLRSVDLAEYAPNLRGSGVHGGLMVSWQKSVCINFTWTACIRTADTDLSPWHLPVVKVLEPRFNVEALALLLNIPPNKTLLRRHLATHFHLLVGSEAQRLKQDCLENPDYTVLTATAKVKVITTPWLFWQICPVTAVSPQFLLNTPELFLLQHRGISALTFSL